MQKAKFHIKGMHCQSCATLIEERLKKQLGVITAKVGFDSQKAVVVYDEKKINESQFQKLMREAGDYQIEIMEKETEEKQPYQDNYEDSDDNINEANRKSESTFKNAAKSSFLVGLLSGLFVVSFLFNIFFVFSAGKKGAVAGSKTVNSGQEQAAQKPSPAETAPAPSAVATFNITKDDHVRGDFNAPITLVEFSDFECPFCGRHFPTLTKILNDYKNQVRLVYKHFPLSFHPNGQKAAEASECADEQKKFWEYHDTLFKNQASGYSIDKFKQWAGELGLNAKKFNNCLDSGKYAQKVQTDFQEGAQKGVNGTPATFVNGQLVSGAVPYEIFKQAIDGLLN